MAVYRHKWLELHRPDFERLPIEPFADFPLPGCHFIMLVSYDPSLLLESKGEEAETSRQVPLKAKRENAEQAA
jgi:hypothetical protein